MKKEDIKTNIEIEGIILTEELIERVKFFQEKNNEGVDDCEKTLGDTICYVGSLMYNMNQAETIKAAAIISELSLVREYYNSFRKP